MNRQRFTLRILIITVALVIAACTPQIHGPGEVNNPGRILSNRFITADEAMLPLKSWLPEQAPVKAVLIAIHGFNDYNNFFRQPGMFFSAQGIACYAYDQRGFGGSPRPGSWSGTGAYVNDLDLFVRLIKRKHPGVPVYVLGESMGGAITLATLSLAHATPVDGAILVAPAVWGRETMPWYQQSALWMLSHTFPGLTLTGRGLKIQASDNIEMLKALSKDPLVIKQTRVEAIHGLTDLMDSALRNAGKINTRTLLVYGEKDQIIPRKATQHFLHMLLEHNSEQKTVAFYPNGFHMLLRDLNAELVLKDIAAWIKSSSPVALPSGADKYAQSSLIADPSSNL